METKILKDKAKELRIAVIEMLNTAGSGHAGGALGLADIFAFLYFHYLKHNPKNPNDPNRDYVLVSNGHVAPIWYASLAYSGYFSINELSTLRKYGSLLQGHPLNNIPGVFNTSGPLGHGITQATGVAAGLKSDKKTNRVYCFTSDGEHDEGAIWENALIANKFRLNNLTLILDRNHIQIDGRTEDIMPLPNLANIYTELGWNVIEINGNDFTEIEKAMLETEIAKGNKPNIIIANTIPGKGVDFMENQFEWHDWKGNDELTKQALEQLHNE